MIKGVKLIVQKKISIAAAQHTIQMTFVCLTSQYCNTRNVDIIIRKARVFGLLNPQEWPTKSNLCLTMSLVQLKFHDIKAVQKTNRKARRNNLRMTLFSVSLEAAMMKKL